MPVPGCAAQTQSQRGALTHRSGHIGEVAWCVGEGGPVIDGAVRGDDEVLTALLGKHFKGFVVRHRHGISLEMASRTLSPRERGFVPARHRVYSNSRQFLPSQVSTHDGLTLPPEPTVATGVSQDRLARRRRADPAAAAPGRGGRRHSLLAEVGDPDLPGRRPAAPGHVRPEAGRAEGDRRPLAADRHQRPRHPDLRGLPAPGADHGQAGRSSARWSATRPTTTPSRCSTATTRASRPPSGGWPQFGSAVAKVQGPVDRRHAAVHQPVLHLHARPLQRAGPRLPRHRRSPPSGRWARRATTWCSAASRWTGSPTARRC